MHCKKVIHAIYLLNAAVLAASVTLLPRQTDYTISANSEFERVVKLGLHLVRTLAKAHPEFVWSSSNMGNRSIKDLLRALEPRDSAIEEFLEEEMRQWEWRIQEYGLPSDRSFEEPKKGVKLPQYTMVTDVTGSTRCDPDH